MLVLLMSGERSPRNHSGEAALKTCSFRPFCPSGWYLGPSAFTRQLSTLNHSGASLDTDRFLFSTELCVLFLLYETYHPLFSLTTIGPGGSDVNSGLERTCRGSGNPLLPLLSDVTLEGCSFGLWGKSFRLYVSFGEKFDPSPKAALKLRTLLR